MEKNTGFGTSDSIQGIYFICLLSKVTIDTAYIKLTRRQRRRYRWSQGMLCQAWEDYRATSMTLKDTKRLLDKCGHMICPTEL